MNHLLDLLPGLFLGVGDQPGNLPSELRPFDRSSWPLWDRGAQCRNRVWESWRDRRPPHPTCSFSNPDGVSEGRGYPSEGPGFSSPVNAFCVSPSSASAFFDTAECRISAPSWRLEGGGAMERGGISCEPVHQSRLVSLQAPQSERRAPQMLTPQTKNDSKTTA